LAAPVNRAADVETALAGRIGAWAAALDPAALPPDVRAICHRLLLDVTGLCVAARNTDYVAATLASAEGSGRATALGHARTLTSYDAALVNGTAAHGEDFDDTFEGGPVHAGAVIVPAVLAVAETRGLSGDAVMKGIAVGVELLCRGSLVSPQAIHKAGFHPTAVLGALAAAAAAGAAIGLDGRAIARALGTAGSMASGIIEYLADGSWTKRLHAGWAAQAGIRSARLAEAAFVGPVTVLEGSHGFYKAFAPSRKPDFAPLVDDLGKSWVTATLAFKPYACGTMTQPFVDCAIDLAKQGVAAGDIAEIVCEVGEGTVHRLWEPLDQKRHVPNGYAGKFSTPYCIAVGFLDGRAGLGQFTDERVRDPRVQAVAAKVSYVINPDDPYPRNFTGHIRASLKDGSVREVRRGHMRGGQHEPLTDGDIQQKFVDNVRFGGWPEERAVAVAKAIERIVEGGAVDLSAARG
jgi:2-methylcitrate dehydratase PrpD